MMESTQEIVQNAIPKVSHSEDKIKRFLKFMANPGQCRSCKAPVWWFTSKAGKSHPVNEDLTSHFSNCPQSRQWRKDRQMQKDKI